MKEFTLVLAIKTGLQPIGESGLMSTLSVT